MLKRAPAGSLEPAVSLVLLGIALWARLRARAGGAQPAARATATSG